MSEYNLNITVTGEESGLGPDVNAERTLCLNSLLEFAIGKPNSSFDNETDNNVIEAIKASITATGTGTHPRERLTCQQPGCAAWAVVERQPGPDGSLQMVNDLGLKDCIYN